MDFISWQYLKFRSFFARYFPALYRLCDRRKAIIKFFLAGSISGGLHLILLYVFHDFWRWSVVLSSSLAFICAFLVSFVLQKLWTFRDYRQDKLIGQLLLYFLNAVFGLTVNGLLMHLLVNRYGLWYILAQIIVNLIIAVQSFLIYKFIVFKKDKLPLDPPLSGRSNQYEVKG